MRRTFVTVAVLLLGLGGGAEAGTGVGAEKAARELLDEQIHRAEVRNVKAGSIGEAAAWVTADLLIQQGEFSDGWDERMRITELVVEDGEAWKATVAHVSIAVTDKAATRRVGEEDESIPEPVPGAVADDDHGALLASPAKLAASVGKDKATAVIGSAPKQSAFGGAKAKKLLRKWAKVRFAVVGGVRWVEGDGWAYGAANVEAKLGKIEVPYRMLAIFRATADKLELVSVHYSSLR